MADIELVIKIDEEIYQHTREYEVGGFNIENDTKLFIAIKNGKPLPKGHGRLIDADSIVKKMEEREEKLKDDRSMWETAGVETALDMFAPTIIEANMESEVE